MFPAWNKAIQPVFLCLRRVRLATPVAVVVFVIWQEHGTGLGHLATMPFDRAVFLSRP
jgi:hypothetical protein